VYGINARALSAIRVNIYHIGINCRPCILFDDEKPANWRSAFFQASRRIFESSLEYPVVTYWLRDVTVANVPNTRRSLLRLMDDDRSYRLPFTRFVRRFRRYIAEKCHFYNGHYT